MPICKPDPDVHTSGWREIDKSDFCVLERKRDSLCTFHTLPTKTAFSTAPQER